jgi:putative endopeptidase
MRDAQDIGRTLGEFAKYKIRGVFWLFSQYENQNDTKYTYTIGIGKVGLPDLSYYKKTAPGKSKTLLKYANLLQQVGKQFDIPNLSNILPTEELLASAIQKSLSEKQFQRKGSELEKEFEEIPFAAIFESFGIDSWKSQTFFVDSKNWLKTLEKMFKFLPLDTWRLLLTRELILHFLPYLPPPFDDLYFNFFHRYLRGQTEKVPQKALTVGILEEWMTPFFSKLYLHYNPSKEIKSDATNLTTELLAAAKQRLQQVNWLQTETKRKAVEKLEKIILSIGYPSSFSKLVVPTVNSENLLENLLSLGSWQTSYEIKRLGEKRNEQKDWDDPVFAVNAYYFSQSNEIVIPLGSLYWPFFSNSAALGWNYGGLGCIIGHELTHAFDKEGKEYDPDGFPKKWWSAADNRAYTKKSKSIVQLFNQQKILNHPVNGFLTLSENIADVGGLAIALDALRMKLEKENSSPEEKKKAYQQFFISYAVSWRVKEKPEKVLQSLFLDYHAPASMRVNLVVSQFQEWYDAFDISEKDPMFISPDKRIRIF